MHEAKNTQRALVRIGYDGRVIKLFRGPKAQERFENECRVLRYLEHRGCDFVPRLLDAKTDSLELVTTNCGAIVERLSDAKTQEIFARLAEFGVRHDDAYLRNITYRPSDGQFCVIDFEFATILEPDFETGVPATDESVDQPTELYWSGFTHCGKHRSNNEDAFLAMMYSDRGIRYLGKDGIGTLKDTDYIFAVSDGMGGERSGEFASKISIEKITLMLPRYFALPEKEFAWQVSRIMTELFVNIHGAMTGLSRTDSNCVDMGATLTLVCVRRGRVYFGHVGDSRLYIKRHNGSIKQISDDHTHVGWLRRTGKLNEREARSHPRKNVLAQALGAGHQSVAPQVDSIEVAAQDQLLLCTDGVSDGLWDRGIDELLELDSQDAEETSPAQRIVTNSIELGRDNSTALVVRFR